MGGVWLGRVGVEKWGDEFSVNGGDGERLLSNISATVSWKHWQKELQLRKPGAYSSISLPSLKMQTLSFGGVVIKVDNENDNRAGFGERNLLTFKKTFWDSV